MGRMRHFVEFTDPRTLFVGQETLNKAKELLKQYETNTLPSGVTDDELWNARILVQNTYARDGEKIPWPFRLSGYALANIPITVGLMWPNVGVAGTVFWQWANQTQNALLNHYNRASIEPLPKERVMTSYAGAVASAVTISVGSNMALAKASISEAMRTNLKRFVPFVAVGTANVCNTVLMRRQELTDGIVVRDEKGEIVGKSQIAAQKAIAATCGSRVVMSACMLTIPPVVLPYIERMSLFANKPKLPLHIAFVSALMFSVVPLSVAVFEENQKIKAEDLEPEFAKKFAGKILTYNKGL
jgi:tricarboxylate carrier